MSSTIDIIQLIGISVLFLVAILEFIGLRKKDSEIRDLNSELDTIKYNISKNETKITEAILESNAMIVPILTKIQRSYAVAKADKVKLLSFLVVLLQNTDVKLLNRITVSKKYSYKEATHNILQYIKNPMYTENQIIKVLDSVYYLITK